MHAVMMLALLSAAPPLTLEEATEMALHRANDMIQAREDLVLVDAEYLSALSAVLPRVDLDFSAGEFFAGRRILESRNPVPAQLPTEFPQVNFGPFRDAQTNNYSHPNISLGLTARQLIYDGGRWWRVFDQVEDSREAKKAALESIERLVRARVAQAFYQLEKTRQQLRTFDAQLEVDRIQVTRAQGLVDAGRGRRADLASAHRDLARDEIQLRIVKSEEAASRRRLNLELGRAPGIEVQLVLPAEVATSSAAAPARYVPGFDALSALAQQHHPLLRSQRAQLRSLDKAVQIAAGEYWPLVALQASYRRSSRRPDRVFNNPFENYTATVDLVVQWNLFAGLGTDAAVQRALVAQHKAQAQYEAAERQVLSDIDQAVEQLSAQTDIMSIAAREIEAAEEAVRLARGQFEAGRGTALELRTAQLGRTQSKLTAISARLEVEIAYAQLVSAVGTDAWQVK